MIKMRKVVFSVLLAMSCSATSWADPYTEQTAQATNAMSDKLEKLLTHFTNYATYFYIDASKPWSDRASGGGNLPSTFDLTEITNAARGLVVNSLYMNPFFSTMFNNYSSPNATVGDLTVNPTVDQPMPNSNQGQGIGTGQFAANPVTQNILNNLNTAIDETNCFDPNCLNAVAIELNIIGTDFLNQPPANAKPFLSMPQSTLDQMNMDTLLGPMVYTTTQPSSGTGSPSFGNPGQPGLSTANQAQQANNFIRHLSGGLLPTTLPVVKRFRENMTTWQDTTKDQPTRNNARGEILHVIAGLRTNGAQLGAGVSNLYYSFMRRMPNPQLGNKSALQSEYEMVSRRLFVQGQQGNNAWHTQMESADIATLLRELNYTLAEINYQLYLNRQMEERMMAAASTIVLEQQQFMRSMVSGDTAVTTDFAIPTPKLSF